MGYYEEGLVSVIMPTYKRSEKLSRAIESVLSQTYEKLELLLINDNDPNDIYTEDLKKRVLDYNNDPRFKLIIQDKHVNGAVARNTGIKKARGEFVAFLDDDDWWEINKLEIQVSELSKLPTEWGGVSCKYRVFDQTGKVIGKTRKYKDGHIYKDILFLLSDVATGTLCLRHNALDDVGYFDESLLRHQDLQLLVDFTYKYKLMEVDAYLHCCDVSDGRNRLKGDDLIQVKELFFESIKPVLSQMSKSDIACAYALHNYEVGYVYFKNGDIINGLKYSFSIFSSVKAFYYSFIKTVTKLKLLVSRDI